MQDWCFPAEVYIVMKEDCQEPNQRRKKQAEKEKTKM